MSKISELTDGGSLLPTDFLIAVRSGGNVKVKADQADFDRIRLGDNEKIELGNNQDLQIYHDGSHSYIKDTGTGDLRVYAQDFQIRNADGSNTMLYANAPTGGIQLFHTGAEKLATSASGISVTGTVTADGLTVDTSATGGFKVEDRGAEGAGVKVTAYQGTTNSNVRQLDVDAYQLTVSTGPVTGATVTDRLLIADNGDISFYEDTGTTPKFFWDASAESLGIGTSSPASGLELEGVGNSTNITLDNTTASTGRSYSIRSGNTGNLDFYDNDATNARMVIDASGNVGIGTPTITSGFKLEVTGDARFGDAVGDDAVELGWSAGGSQGFIQAYDRGASAFRPLNINNSLTVDASGQLSAVSASNVRLTLGSEGTVGNNSSNWIRGNSTSLQFNNAGGGFMWEAIGSEKMRLDAGGSLLIGKTTPADLHNTWNHIIIGEKGAIISENGAGGIDGITLADNAYIDSDTGTYAYQTTAAASQITQSGGAITFSNAASGSAGAALTPVPRMTLDASGNFIVGATSAFNSSSFCVDQSGFGQFRRDGTPLIVRRDGSFGDLIPFEKDGATIGGISVVDSDPTGGGGELLVASGNTGLKFDDQVNYIRPANAAGGGRDNIIDLGNSSNRFKDLYLSGGVYLGGIGAANLLDDYEEGTWTPEIYYQNATDQGNATNTTQTGYYTKIGRVVTVDFRLIWNITGSPANDNIGVKNLPFAGGGDTFAAAGVAYPINNSTTIPTLLLTRPSDGGTLLLCQSGEMSSNLGNEFGSGNAKEIRGTVTYFTAA